MNAELKFVVVPGADQQSITLSVTLDTDLAPKLFQRQLLALDVQTLEAFRRGELGALEFEKLMSDVNSWLLDAPVRAVLNNALTGTSNGTGLRLVFVVPDEARDAIAAIPLELLWHDTADSPLVLRKDIESLAYYLSKAKTAPENLAARNWPLKVLIVRANPLDWGGKVPTVAPLKKHILDQAADYGPGMVEVDVISSEGGAATPASWAALRAHLAKTSDYNVLVYLGHGELAEPPTGGTPIGHLYMESPDGEGHQAIGAPQLAKLLSDYPVPLVVLAGCVTAVEQPGLVRRRGAEQGIAQALVNSSEAGVQMAVGMRMEVLGTAAMRFLNEFFTSLLKGAPGDVDRAVRKARNELFLDTGRYPPHWAAPVVFRANNGTPGFDFINSPVTFRVSPDMAKWLDLRTRLWNRLGDSLSHIDPARLKGMLEALDATEIELRKEGVAQGPLLLPRLAQAVAGQTSTVAVEVVGKLSVAKLRADLQVPTGLTVQKLTLEPAVKAAGFKLLLDQDDRGYFEVQATSGLSTALPETALLQAEVSTVDGAAVYPVTIALREVVPKTLLWPGDNVVVAAP